MKVRPLMFICQCKIFTPHIKGSNCSTQLMYHTLWLTKYYIIPTGIHCKQLWNVIIIAVIVLYFWICNVFLDLSWYFCNHIVLLQVELSH